MKKLLLLLGFCIYAAIGIGQDALSTHFEEYQTSDDFTNIYISQKMFGMMANVNIEEAEGQEIMSIVKDLTGLRIMKTEKADASFYKNAVKKLTTNSFEELMTVKENNKEIVFLVKEGRDGAINELILITSEGLDVVLMSFEGNINLSKLAKLAKKLDINGAEHLDKLKERK